MRCESLISVALLISCVSPLFQGACASDLNDKSNALRKVISGYNGKMIYREVQIIVNRNAREYFNEFTRAPLKVFLPGTDKISGVEKTVALTAARFPAVGSKRLVCLKDGSTAVERVIDLKSLYFKYKVSDYSFERARPIEFGIGEFWFEPVTATSLLIRWRYSFKLKTDMFPGNIGCIGRMLFKWSFLDSDYADFMKSGIFAIKAYGERKEKL